MHHDTRAGATRAWRDPGRWATGCLPEPQSGTTNVSVPGRGVVPESKLRSLGGGIKRTQRDLLGSGSWRVEGAQIQV